MALCDGECDGEFHGGRVGQRKGIEPDIWGTVVGMVLMTVALLATPFVDRAPREPANRQEAFDWRQRDCQRGLVVGYTLGSKIGLRD